MKRHIFLAVILLLITINLSAQQVEIYQQLGEQVEIDCISYSPDGRFVLTVGNSIPDRSMISSGVFNLIGYARDHIIGVRSVKIWDAENGRELKTLFTDFINADVRTYCGYAEYSPDGKTVMFVINRTQQRNYLNGIIRIVDVETGQTIRQIFGHTGIIYAAIFSQDGKRIVSCGNDRTIKIWNTDNGQEIRTITGHTNTVYSVAWGPGGRQIASASEHTVCPICRQRGYFRQRAERSGKPT